MGWEKPWCAKGAPWEPWEIQGLAERGSSIGSWQGRLDEFLRKVGIAEWQLVLVQDASH